MLSLLLQACISTSQTSSVDPLLTEAINYKETIDENHPDHLNQLFYVPEGFTSELQERFGRLDSIRAANKIAKWLVSDDGYGLAYDIKANLTPSEAIEQKRGNCLSFTLLIIELGKNLDIKIEANQVDVPDEWGENGQEDLVFYRHVNAIMKHGLETQILDLAISEYDYGYPQRIISRIESAGLMYSNKGVEALAIEDFETALHYLKLAVSHFPDNPDMWINLGALYKAQHQYDEAEASYLRALSLRDKNNLAASNLERLYRLLGNSRKAELYAAKAEKARRKNPYYLFKVASQKFLDQHYDDALVSVNKAIKHHKKDHRFFSLRSEIHKAKEQYIKALEDLAQASLLTNEESDIIKYRESARSVVARLQSSGALEQIDLPPESL